VVALLHCASGCLLTVVWVGLLTHPYLTGRGVYGSCPQDATCGNKSVIDHNSNPSAVILPSGVVVLAYRYTFRSGSESVNIAVAQVLEISRIQLISLVLPPLSA
jgi:hypothetical protein